MNRLKLIFISLLVCYALFTKAQCISIYPHTETFESAPTWTAGGSNSDWTWGTPSKPSITGAGGGLKCWCVAGLAGTTYNNSEQSYIKSPCYNFSTLTYPYVSFKVFWESEWLYDGASLQYSTNNGTTWTTVGAFGDPVNCMTQNWYNKASINYLSWITPTNKNGWAGNVQPTVGSCQGGNGSGNWVTAKHCLNGLAGQSNVMFRFTFGSGTTCNDFDGFAIDDFTIDNAPANAPAFTYTCNSFTSVNPTCPIPSSYLWNFGDPASGATNTSTLSNPIHIFSSPGIYTVSLTTSGGPCNPTGTITQTVSALGFSVTSSSSITCYGANNGSATVSASFGTPAYSYTWLPSGGNANSASSLSAGNYTVIVKDVNGCSKSNTLSITQPSSLTAAVSQTNVSCFGGTNGSINITANGGIAPYTYTWLPSNSNGNVLVNLPMGTYTCLINDANLCATSTITSISQPSTALAAIASSSPAACSFPTGIANVTASGGTPSYTYIWFPNGGTSNTANNLVAGTYSVQVSDVKSCTVIAITTVTNSLGPTSVLTATNIVCYGGGTGVAQASVSGSSGPYTYTWQPSGGNSNIASNLSVGIYTCIAADVNQCTVSNSISISQGPQILISIPNYSACQNEITVITATANGGNGGPFNYSWNLGGVNTSSIIVHSSSTINYSVVATDVNGCNSSPTSTQLFIYNTLHAHFTPSNYEVSVTDPVVAFTDASDGNPISWHWDFAALATSSLQNTSYHFPTDGTYLVQLNITDSNGCKDSITESIKVSPEFTFYMPNTFTPNGDNLNDVFIAQGTGWDESTYQFRIFDRWGALIYYTTDYTKGWDGKIKNLRVPLDVYVWKVEVFDLQKKRHQYIGHVSLID